MKVAAYLRCSTKSQVGEGKYGLDSQRADIAAFCSANGHEIVAEFIDNGSGTKSERPGFIQLLEAAKRKEFSIVVVGKGDRLARTVKVDGYLRVLLETCGARVLSATERNASADDDDGEMVEGMLAVVAQRVRKDIVRRLATARKVKAATGGYAHGKPRFGTTASGKALVANVDEIHTLDLMRNLRAAGLTIRQIVEKLNADGVATRTGKPWGTSSVHRILARV